MVLVPTVVFTCRLTSHPCMRNSFKRVCDEHISRLVVQHRVRQGLGRVSDWWKAFTWTILAYERVTPSLPQTCMHTDVDFVLLLSCLVGSWRTVVWFLWQIPHSGGPWSHCLAICLFEFVQLKHTLFFDKSFLSWNPNSWNFWDSFRMWTIRQSLDNSLAWSQSMCSVSLSVQNDLSASFLHLGRPFQGPRSCTGAVPWPF